MSASPVVIVEAPVGRGVAPLIGRVFAGAAAGLLIAAGFVVKSHFDAETVSEVFRSARVSLRIFRVEKGSWPQDFDFAAPPADLGNPGFAPVSRLLTESRLDGRWRFERAGPEGRPAIVLRPTESGRSVERMLRIIDASLDDGRPEGGDFRLKDGRAFLMLRDE